MPFLDVASETLLDPMLADSFTVTRRLEAVGNKGRSTTTNTVTNNVIGVVTAASPNDLERLEDMDRAGRHLSIVTKFPLQMVAKDSAGNKYKPDLVTFQGDDFIVKYVDPYWKFGGVGGFTQAIVGSINLVDAPT